MGLRLALVLVVLLPFGASGQLFDSIALFLQEEPRIIAKLDLRGSFVGNRGANFIGVKVGLEHADRFQYGVGYSFLMAEIDGEATVDGLGNVPTRLRMGYVAPYVDYAFYQRGPWEIRLPVQVGFGSASVRYKDAEGRSTMLKRTGLVVYEPAMTVQYRFLKYMAVGGGWGFRLVMHTRSGLGENLSAPIYLVGLRIFFGDIYRDLVKPE
jgi:hypothetical protein